ncbi:MAG TPA: YetF domain-containing protein [Terriglobales bacterium]
MVAISAALGSSMYPGIHVIGAIVLRTLVIYIVVLIGVRVSGKREVGQMTPFDLVLLLLISNSVQNAMTGPDNSVVGGIAAALTLLLMNYVIADLSGANRRFRKIIQGQPTLLVHNGSLLLPHMAKEHVSMDELERALREHGINNYHEVALAVLEVDGSISCLKYDELNPQAPNHPVRRKYLQKHQ